jgi:2-keto-4-pentenoate hydratase/2-oxohepta-3-ene-1,7-dioic acid hydratase in catechol pathway
VVGAGQSIAGFTVLAEWRADGLAPPKDRDFALGLGPVVVTADELTQPDDFDWGAAIALASANTTLYPGDLVAAPPREPVRPGPGGAVSVEIDGIGALEQRIAD